MDHVERVRIGRFSSRAEAQVARAMLSEHGIEATVVVDDVAGLHPELSLATGGLALEVLPDDAAEARELLDDVPRQRSGQPSARPRLRRRLVVWLMLALAVLLAVAVVTAVAEVGLDWR